LGTRAGNGGSGIVIISYEAGSAGWTQFTYSDPNGWTTSQARGGKWVTHTITASGTLTPITTRT
jgi:hypothetical protein